MTCRITLHFISKIWPKKPLCCYVKHDDSIKTFAMPKWIIVHDSVEVISRFYYHHILHHLGAFFCQNWFHLIYVRFLSVCVYIGEIFEKVSIKWGKVLTCSTIFGFFGMLLVGQHDYWKISQNLLWFKAQILYSLRALPSYSTSVIVFQ